MTTTISADQIPSDLRQEITEALGTVPEFLRTLDAPQLRLWWATMRDYELNEDTALDGKTKNLIGVGVASQIPCDYCLKFHSEAARLHGATDTELRESVYTAALTRQGSTILNGAQLDKTAFANDVDAIVEHVRSTGGAQAPHAT